MIDDTTIAHIAALAKLDIPSADKATYRKDLNAILTMVEGMNAVATDDITPMTHPLESQQRLRADHITETNVREAMHTCTSNTQGGLYIVPSVME